MCGYNFAITSRTLKCAKITLLVKCCNGIVKFFGIKITPRKITVEERRDNDAEQENNVGINQKKSRKILRNPETKISKAKPS